MSLQFDNKTGIWSGDNVNDFHRFDEKLCSEICLFLNEEDANKVSDFGCGNGKYVEQISENIECKGYDGNPDTPNLTAGLGVTMDLSKSVIVRQVDWVLSLEVGNHIPEDFECVFLDNIYKTAKKGVIISWATPRQKGPGQLNKQDNSYIISKFTENGFTYDSKSTERLRDKSEFFWLKKSLMVFRKQSLVV